jgi:hypothetical protein
LTRARSKCLRSKVASPHIPLLLSTSLVEQQCSERSCLEPLAAEEARVT